jgi:hypothetical protein
MCNMTQTPLLSLGAARPPGQGSLNILSWITPRDLAGLKLNQTQALLSPSGFSWSRFGHYQICSSIDGSQ